MAKTREQKEQLLGSYKELLQNSAGYFAVDLAGIDTATLTQLKKELKAAGSNISTVKNSVFKIALQEGEKPLEAQNFDGQTAITTYSDDPTAIAKILKKYQESTEVLVTRYAVIDNAYLNSSDAKAMADIPSREELLAKLLGSMSAPLTGFLRVGNGPVRGFTQILQQLSEKEA